MLSTCNNSLQKNLSLNSLSLSLSMNSELNDALALFLRQFFHLISFGATNEKCPRCYRKMNERIFFCACLLKFVLCFHFAVLQCGDSDCIGLFDCTEGARTPAHKLMRITCFAFHILLYHRIWKFHCKKLSNTRLNKHRTLCAIVSFEFVVRTVL